jgi:hypothetical protein
MLLNRDFKRLGDIAGGTVVVYRDRPCVTLRYRWHPIALHLAPCHCPNNARYFDFATRAGTLPSSVRGTCSLCAALDRWTAGRERVARLMSIANYLIGRKPQ